MLKSPKLSQIYALGPLAARVAVQLSLYKILCDANEFVSGGVDGRHHWKGCKPSACVKSLDVHEAEVHCTT
jgi:hypothetical protein